MLEFFITCSPGSCVGVSRGVGPVAFNSLRTGGGGAISSDDIQSDTVHGADNGHVAEGDDAQRVEPRTNKKDENEHPGPHVVRQVIKTATGQVALGYIFAQAHQWHARK